MNLVLTICQGSIYNKVGKLTHPTLKAYALKIGADFMVIDERKISESTPHWEKFQIFDLLNEYERIIYVDSDIIISSVCPNLFDIVPKNKLGAFNEGPFVERSKEMMIEICKEYDTKLSHWDGKYYNTGVMVVSRLHKFLFKKPEKEFNKYFWEQSYLNMAIVEHNIEVYELEYKFNRMTCMDKFTGEHRLTSYIVHYAGCPNPQWILDIIPRDIYKWKKGETYKRHIHVNVSGGLGDQMCAEPSINFMKKYVYPDAHIVISTHYPELFKHINGIEIYKHGKFIPEDDTPYYLMQTLPGPETINWMVVSNLLCHTVDYSSMATLRRILPNEDKRFTLEVRSDSIEYLKSVIKVNLKDLIVVHPGRHWQSKTLPISYWQDLINGLSVNHHVCLIGRNDEITRGTVNITCPKNTIDLRDLTELPELIALLSQAKILISNDSAPIHLAGAFDNWIFLIPTCKHPDHVMPYRNGSMYYKSMSFYKKLIADEFDAKPTCVNGSSGAEFTKNWDDYLLPINDIINKVKEVIK